jgi:adenosylcobinamide kinase/adenosylcobinamide-phosphate guanylyltransferase
MARLILVLGGARSGKSGRALQLAEGQTCELVFVATAQAFDDEMTERIARHRAERDARWRTMEAPLELADAVALGSSPGTLILVDCLTLWLSNLLLAGRDVDLETRRLAEAVGSAAGPIILVSNEVGFGIVPETPLGRAFRDHQGRLNQAMAQVCDRAELLVAGLPLTLKG